jgi:hypothetical protein
MNDLLPTELLLLIAEDAAIELSGCSAHLNGMIHKYGLYVRDRRFVPFKKFGAGHPSLSDWTNVEQRLTFLEWAILKDQRRIVGYLLGVHPWSCGYNGARSITMAIRLRRTECLRLLIRALPVRWLLYRYCSKILGALNKHPDVAVLKTMIEEMTAIYPSERLFQTFLSCAPRLSREINDARDAVPTPYIIDYYLEFAHNVKSGPKKIELDGIVLVHGTLEQIKRFMNSMETKDFQSRLVEVYRCLRFGAKVGQIIEKLRSLSLTDTFMLETLTRAMRG